MISKRFLAAIGLAGLFAEKTTAKDHTALEKERDEAVGVVQKAHDAFAALENEIAAERTKFTDDLAALTTQLEAARQEKATLEAAIPGRISAEVARIAAAQGVPPGDVPPANPGGGGGGTEADLTAAIAEMRAEKDPVKKGKLCDKIDALRKKAN